MNDKTTIHLVISGAAMVLLAMVFSHYLDNAHEKVCTEQAKYFRMIDRYDDIMKKLHVIDVTATIYQAVPSQTDSSPGITADGTRIHKQYAGKYRYIAVSPDLLKENGGPITMGDFVIIQNTDGHYDGVWQVKDKMPARWVHRIDFLTNIGTKSIKFDHATLILLEEGLIHERKSYQGKLEMLSYLPKTGGVSNSGT